MRHPLQRLFVVVCALLTSLAACGSDADTSSEPADCARWAAQVCSLAAGCGSTYVWGTHEECLNQTKAQCTRSVLLPDTGFNAATFAECGTLLEASACGDKGDCTPPLGRRPIGADCVASSQCESLYCLQGKPTDCGICYPTLLLGEPCTFGCRADLRCIADADGKSTCVPPLAVGAPCVDKANVDPCAFPAQCVHGVCTRPVPVDGDCTGEKPCVAPNFCNGSVCAVPAGEGEPCKGRKGECDQSLLLRCASVQGVTACRAPLLAYDGEACGVTSAGVALCVGPCEVQSGQDVGICHELLPLGSACVVKENGRSLCAGSTRCVGGTCTLDVAMCE